LAFVAVTAIFILAFYFNKTSAMADYKSTNEKVPSIKYFGGDSIATTQNLFVRYGVLMGIGLCLLTLLGSNILYLIAKLARLSHKRLAIPIIIVVNYAFWTFLGFELSFLESRTTTWANAIIFFIGRPFFYASLLVMLAGAAAIIITLAKDKGGTDSRIKKSGAGSDA
jgi:hypothetical protein